MDSNRKWFVFLTAFFLANLFLSSYFLDIWPTPNTASRALPVITFSENRTLIIDKYAYRTKDKSRVGNHFYSDKAPLPTFIAIPFYELAKAVGLTEVGEETGKKYPLYIFKIKGYDDAREYIYPKLIPILLIGDFLAGSVPFAVIILLSFLALHKNKPSISPVVMVMFAYYGSIIFVFSGTFFNHVAAGFLLLVSYIWLKRANHLLCGVFLGLSFLSEYTVIIAAPIWLMLILINFKRLKPAIFFLSGIVPSIIFVSSYNWIITGTPFKALNAYHADEEYIKLSNNYGFSYPTIKALWGLSFSGSMGMFVFAPVLFLIAYCLIKWAINNKIFYKKILSAYLPLFSIVFFVVIASFFTWWGGWSYGPRYLTALVVLLIYEGLIFISKFKINIYIYLLVTGFGVTSAWFAKSTLVYMIPDLFLGNKNFSNTFLNILVPEFVANRFNANNLFTFIFDIRPAIAVYLWILFFIFSVIIFYIWYYIWFEKIIRS